MTQRSFRRNTTPSVPGYLLVSTGVIVFHSPERSVGAESEVSGSVVLGGGSAWRLAGSCVDGLAGSPSLCPVEASKRGFSSSFHKVGSSVRARFRLEYHSA